MDSKTGDLARVGRSVCIKGELSGSEDLYVDGQVEGTLDLPGNGLTIGPNGHVHANVNAKTVVVHGKIEGNIRSSDRTELRKSAVATGDIFTQRISIEEGAFFKGRVEIQKAALGTQSASQPENKFAQKLEVGTPATQVPAASTVTSASSSSIGVPEKTPLTETKKY